MFVCVFVYVRNMWYKMGLAGKNGEFLYNLLLLATFLVCPTIPGHGILWSLDHGEVIQVLKLKPIITPLARTSLHLGQNFHFVNQKKVPLFVHAYLVIYLLYKLQVHFLKSTFLSSNPHLFGPYSFDSSSSLLVLYPVLTSRVAMKATIHNMNTRT